jgi:hypothetical protein
MKTPSYQAEKKNNFKDCVAISIGVPKTFKGRIAHELCPTWGMVNAGYSYDQYVELLRKRKVVAQQVLKKYADKVLLCYELKADCDEGRTCCHRHYLAKWIHECTGIVVKEREHKTDGQEKLCL